MDTLVEGTTRSTQRERAHAPPPPPVNSICPRGPTTFCHGKSQAQNARGQLCQEESVQGGCDGVSHLSPEDSDDGQFQN